ncbi:MAG: hypothetical protein AB7G21_11110 [Dehalococcoidia bacterium]
MPRLTTRALILGLAAFAVLGVVALAPRTAEAQLPPFKAFGSGLASGKVVTAWKGSTQVGQSTVNASGNWDINIDAGGSANVQNGDKITFKIDGAMANESATFNVGQFTPPPGLKLTLAVTATPTPTPGPAGATGPTVSSTGPGTFAKAPVFSESGIASVVYNGGSAEALAKVGTDAGARSIWAQTPDGMIVGFIPGAPDFVNAAFLAAFPNGLGLSSVYLVK